MCCNSTMIKALPNIISITRIFLIPFILYSIIQNFFFLAFILCCLASISDALDGFLARKLNNETKFGFYLDAIADKLFIFSIYSIIGIKLLLPIYVIFFVILRDIFIFGSYIMTIFIRKNINLKPTNISKVNTFMQMLLIIIILLNLSEINFLYVSNNEIIIFLSYVVVFTTVTSFIVYINYWFNEYS